MRRRIAKYRRSAIGPGDSPQIGCILLAEPFLWKRSDWIRCPGDFASNTVVGKGYDSEAGVGRDASPATVAAIESHEYGKPHIVQPRLGQGLFRVLVTNAYSRRCSVTNERTLPVLEATHIKPFKIVQRHDLSNGLLLRSDLHKLFDEGYITIDPGDRRVVVSRRIRQEFENGRDYYHLDERSLNSLTFSTENV